MINGNAREFIDGLYYGDERFFLHNGNKYFIQGYFKEGEYILEMYIFDTDNDFYWQAVSARGDYPVEEFESAKVFCGKTFWEAENEIEWVDC